MKGFLEYVPGESFLHTMNPVAKLAAAFLLVIACFTTSSFILLAVVIALDAVMAVQCKMVAQTIGLAKAVAVFSVVLALIALLFTPQGDVLVSLPWGYVGTASVLNAVLIVVRLVACAVPLFLVFYVTKLTDMANALVKVLHVPYKYAFTFMSTVHFIPVFMNDMAGIMEAQTARGVEFDGGLVKKVRLMIPLCVPLLVQPAHTRKRLQGVPLLRHRLRRDGNRRRTTRRGYFAQRVVVGKRLSLAGAVFGI